jgi:hypothetical protein
VTDKDQPVAFGTILFVGFAGFLQALMIVLLLILLINERDKTHTLQNEVHQTQYVADDIDRELIECIDERNKLEKSVENLIIINSALRRAEQKEQPE